MSANDHLSSNITSAEFLYDLQQYVKILTAFSATSAISMFCSLLISVAYVHLRISHPDKANRVSLRCVFMASLMNLANSVFDIVVISIYGDTYTCRASAIIAMFTRVMSAVFLALVGVNLVLVFVCNVGASAHRLECIYYPSAIIYGLISVIIPIVESADDVLSARTDLRCYYFIHYYQFLGHSSLLWMWFYGFLFLSVMVAVICSITALIKLMREHNTLIQRWVHIASTSQTADSTQSNVEQRIKSQSNVFMRVVSRCVLYPLVPLITNIWGFIFQIYCVNPHNGVPNFAFSLTDAIFKCLQGFFVAIVFFSDPAMTHYISEQWSLCKEKYIDDFNQIRRYSDGQLEIVSLNNRNSNPKQVCKSQSSSITIMPSCLSKPASRNQAQMSAEDEISNNDWENKGKRVSHDSVAFNTVPMRRLSVPASVYSRIQHNEATFNRMSTHWPQSSLSTSSTTVDFDSPSRKPSQSCITDPQSNHRILVPYKYPRFASAFHWLLVKCGIGKSASESPAMSPAFQPHQLSPILDATSAIDIPPSVHPLTQTNSIS